MSVTYVFSQQDTISNDHELALLYYHKGDSCEQAFNIYEALDWYTKGRMLVEEPLFLRKLGYLYTFASCHIPDICCIIDLKQRSF